MTRDDIIRMAGEAGFIAPAMSSSFLRHLERFAALVAAAEREACAAICDHYDSWGPYRDRPQQPSAQGGSNDHALLASQAVLRPHPLALPRWRLAQLHRHAEPRPCSDGERQAAREAQTDRRADSRAV